MAADCQGAQRSGLTVREFCRKSKLHESAFLLLAAGTATPRRWRGVRQSKSNAAQGHPASAGAAFVPVQGGGRSSRPSAGRIEIELSGGRRIHVDGSRGSPGSCRRAGGAGGVQATEGRPC